MCGLLNNYHDDDDNNDDYVWFSRYLFGKYSKNKS